MKPEELNALINKYFKRENYYGALSPFKDDYTARWVCRHNGKWYVQTGEQSVDTAKGIEYDTLEEAVVCAVALMEMEMEVQP